MIASARDADDRQFILFSAANLWTVVNLEELK